MPENEIQVAEAPAPPNMLAVIASAAKDPAVDIAKFERLIAIRRELESDRARREFAEAFAELGADLPIIDRKGRIVVYSRADRDKPGGPRENDTPIQATPYATFEDILQACRPSLYKHGFSVRFEYPQTPDGRIIVAAILQHKGGHAEQAWSPPLQHDATGSKNTVQAVGSSLSYGMRYAFRAIVPIVSHAPQDKDDDGNAAGRALAGPDQITDIETRLRDTQSDRKIFLKWLDVADDLSDMTVDQYEHAKDYLDEKARRRAAAKP